MHTTSLPAKISANRGALAITSKFSLDRTQWGMTYGQGKIHDDVTLTINVNAKK